MDAHTGDIDLKRIVLAAAAVVVAIAVGAIPPGTDEEIAERIKPVGGVLRVGDAGGADAGPAASGPLSGEQVYTQFCGVCHAAGVGGAPLLGDPGQWQPRIDKGMDALMASTLNGLNAMPPKGTCMNCSDEELGAAVDYMLSQVQ